ncbi:MAG: YihA family ribosome biosis GTP-binding protein [Deltaproteobacteria bacterium]|nr:YihA family ribosome biosis GTP-binding protein [Deltaproteobacteria bacterium]
MTFPGARFLLFDPVGDAWPAVRLPQVAFAGRSNVGKSSLFNALIGQSRLARVSNTPGRTRGIAIFEVTGRFAFADLPGYGFAKVSRSERNAWKALVEGYLSGCRQLRRVYILVDLRRGPEEEERRLAEYLSAHSVSYRWVGTKGDKLSSREMAEALSRFGGEPWLDAGGGVLATSARTKDGIDRLRSDVRAAFLP